MHGVLGDESANKVMLGLGQPGPMKMYLVINHAPGAGLIV